MNKGKKQLLIAVVCLAAAIVLIAVGVVLTQSRESDVWFRVLSIPAAIAIVIGGGEGYYGIRYLTGPDRMLRIAAKKTGYLDCVVLGVARNLRSSEREKQTYYIVAQYTDPATGESRTFSSRSLEKYPGKDVIGKPVRVYLDPDDPGSYRVDIDPLLKKGRKR